MEWLIFMIITLIYLFQPTKFLILWIQIAAHLSKTDNENLSLDHMTSNHCVPSHLCEACLLVLVESVSLCPLPYTNKVKTSDM